MAVGSRPLAAAGKVGPIAAIQPGPFSIADIAIERNNASAHHSGATEQFASTADKASAPSATDFNLNCANNVLMV